jgi:hypothetical protein
MIAAPNILDTLNICLSKIESRGSPMYLWLQIIITLKNPDAYFWFDYFDDT